MSDQHRNSYGKAAPTSRAHQDTQHLEEIAVWLDSFEDDLRATYQATFLRDLAKRLGDGGQGEATFTLAQIHELLALGDVVDYYARARWDRQGRPESFDDLSFVRSTELKRIAREDLAAIRDALTATQPTPSHLSEEGRQAAVDLLAKAINPDAFEKPSGFGHQEFMAEEREERDDAREKARSILASLSASSDTGGVDR